MPTVEWNKQTWTKNVKHWEGKLGYYGEQWGKPEDKPHLKHLLDHYLLPFVNPEHTVLEIGSGGGRWTQYMLPFKKVVCVDVNEVMMELLRERFGEQDHFEYVLSSGTDFPGVPEQSIDFVFSHGVFVHIDPLETYDYLCQLHPLMRSGAKGVIQYADQNKPKAQENAGFARNNPRLMRCMVEHAGFEIIDEDTTTLQHSAVVVFEPRR